MHKNKKRVFTLFALLGCLLAMAALSRQLAPREMVATESTSGAAANELLIKFKQNPAEGTNYRVEIESLDQIPSPVPIYKATLKSGTNLQNTLTTLKNDPNVEFAEPNYRVTVLAMPDDPYFSTNGGWSQVYRDQWGLETLDMNSAWDITESPISSPIIAVVDTGLDYTHPDINSSLWYNSGEVTIPAGELTVEEDDTNQNGIIDCADMLEANQDGEDNDENGYVDDICGWNFVNNDNDPRDTHGHGTSVSGVIAAETDNAQGIAGMCWNCRIMPLRFMSSDGGGWMSDAIRAINYAITNGATVINNSWGVSGYSQSLQDVIDTAYDSGILVVAAAGNTNSDVAHLNPAAMNHVIAVAALGSNGLYKSTYSNYGEEIDFVAPGEKILSLRARDPLHSGSYLGTHSATTPVVGTQYIATDGTSMAAPYVTGIIGLIQSVRPELSPFQIEYLLRSTAIDIYTSGIAQGKDNYTGYGLPNAAAALEAQVDTESPVATLINAPAAHTNLRYIDITVGPSDEITAFRYKLDNGSWSATDIPKQLHIMASSLAEGDHTLSVIARDSIGNWQSVNEATVYYWNIDTNAPARITTLENTAYSSDSLTFAWTATGDDGTVGQATTYVIKYSLSPLTDANWSSATLLEQGLTPALSGTAGQTVTLTNLNQLSAYFLGIKVMDEAGNSSVLSNIASGFTTASGAAVLVKGTAPLVYLLENSVLFPIPSSDVFQGLGYNWADIRVIPDLTILGYPRGDALHLTYTPGSVVKTRDNPTVYLITVTGERQAFSCAAVFLANQLSWHDIRFIDNASLEAYPIGPAITSEACAAEIPPLEPEITTPVPQTPPSSTADVYIVKAGDWLLKIARDFSTSLSDILSRNRITDPDKIYPGQQILIP